MEKLSPPEVEAALKALPGWSIRDGAVVKTFAHKTFPEAILFVNAVSHVAEAANHHPDIDIRYTQVTLALITHDQGGLTTRDFSLAQQIESLRRGSKTTA